jgi:hypothetical protein
LPAVALNCSHEKAGLLTVQSALLVTVMSWLPPSGAKEIVDTLTVRAGAGVFAFVQAKRAIIAARNTADLKKYIFFILFYHLIKNCINIPRTKKYQHDIFLSPATIEAQLHVDLFTVNFVLLKSSPFWRIQNGKFEVVISGSP